MSPRKLYWNRRREQRHRCDFRSIKWIKQGNNNMSRGWLNDQSWSGLSFITASPHRPQIGEDIELSTKSHGDRTCCRVVRVEELEDDRAVIGCQKDVPGNVILQDRPKRKIIENVRVPKNHSRAVSQSK